MKLIPRLVFFLTLCGALSVSADPVSTRPVTVNNVTGLLTDSTFWNLNATSARAGLGLAPSATTDTTNAANITSGLLRFSVLPSTIVRNYATEAMAAVDQRIAGKTASAGTMAVYSSTDDTGHHYVRNTALWCPDLDLTCISASSASGWRVTAVTPRHGITAQHIAGSFNVGDSLYFVDANNNTCSTTISALTQIGSSDICLVTFSSDLPSSITPAVLLPATLPLNFPWAGCPIITHNQNRHLCVAEIVSLQIGSPSTDNYISPALATRQPWSRTADNGGVSTPPAITGDSSSPIFLVLGGSHPVFLGTFATSTTSPDVGANAAAIQTAIGSSYTLSVMPVAGYPAAITNVVAGLTSTLSAGSPASASPSLVSGTLSLNLGIPTGATGAVGAAGSSATVTPGTAGTSSGSGHGGTAGATTNPPFVLQSGTGGNASSSGNGGNGNAIPPAITLTGGSGGSSGGAGNGGNGGPIFGSPIQIIGGTGGGGNSGNGGNGGTIQPGAITIRAGNGGANAGFSSSATGGNGGSTGNLTMNGGNGGTGLMSAGGVGGNSGGINVSGADANGSTAGFNGGSINMAAGSAYGGGSVNLSNGGNTVTLGTGATGGMGLYVPVPANSASVGAPDQWSSDDNYFYVYGASGWRRISSSSF